MITLYIMYKGWYIEKHSETRYVVWVDDKYRIFEDLYDAYEFIDEMIKK